MRKLTNPGFNATLKEIEELAAKNHQPQLIVLTGYNMIDGRGDFKSLLLAFGFIAQVMSKYSHIQVHAIAYIDPEQLEISKKMAHAFAKYTSFLHQTDHGSATHLKDTQHLWVISANRNPNELYFRFSDFITQSNILSQLVKNSDCLINISVSFDPIYNNIFPLLCPTTVVHQISEWGNTKTFNENEMITKYSFTKSVTGLISPHQHGIFAMSLDDAPGKNYTDLQFQNTFLRQNINEQESIVIFSYVKNKNQFKIVLDILTVICRDDEFSAKNIVIFVHLKNYDMADHQFLQKTNKTNLEIFDSDQKSIHKQVNKNATDTGKIYMIDFSAFNDDDVNKIKSIAKIVSSCGDISTFEAIHNQIFCIPFPTSFKVRPFIGLKNHCQEVLNLESDHPLLSYLNYLIYFATARTTGTYDPNPLDNFCQIKNQDYKNFLQLIQTYFSVIKSTWLDFCKVLQNANYAIELDILKVLKFYFNKRFSVQNQTEPEIKEFIENHNPKKISAHTDPRIDEENKQNCITKATIGLENYLEDLAVISKNDDVVKLILFFEEKYCFFDPQLTLSEEKECLLDYIIANDSVDCLEYIYQNYPINFELKNALTREPLVSDLLIYSEEKLSQLHKPKCLDYFIKVINETNKNPLKWRTVLYYAYQTRSIQCFEHLLKFLYPSSRTDYLNQQNKQGSSLIQIIEQEKNEPFLNILKRFGYVKGDSIAANPQLFLSSTRNPSAIDRPDNCKIVTIDNSTL